MGLITVKPAPKPVQDFIRNATPPQRMGFLGKGNPECIEVQIMGGSDIKTAYFPGLRGVLVGKEVDTPEAAIAAAQDRLSEFLSEKQESVDEAALGIDTEGYDISLRFNSIGCRLENIIHIGAMTTRHEITDDLEDLIQDFCHSEKSAIFDDLPLLRSLVDDHKAGGPDPVAFFAEACHEAGEYGFIVVVSMPEHRPHPDRRGATVHSGVSHVEYRYASTFQVACDRAAEWAEAEYQRMMATPIPA